jgi:hypothetical protein
MKARDLKHLPRVRSALRRLYPGPRNVGARFTIRRTAESKASRGGTAEEVLAEVESMHRHRVSPLVLAELRRALAIDLPEPAEGSASR